MRKMAGQEEIPMETGASACETGSGHGTGECLIMLTLHPYTC